MLKTVAFNNKITYPSITKSLTKIFTHSKTILVADMIVTQKHFLLRCSIAIIKMYKHNNCLLLESGKQHYKNIKKSQLLECIKIT